MFIEIGFEATNEGWPAQTGQLFGLFPRFVQRCGVRPYKLEKNLRFFLESAEKHRNFALSKETDDTDNNKV